MPDGKLWTQRDRFGNDIYLTIERWQHITRSDNHPELTPHLELVRETIRLGRRRQESLRSNGLQILRTIPGFTGRQYSRSGLREVSLAN